MTDYANVELPTDPSGYSMMDIEPTSESVVMDEQLWQQQLEGNEQQDKDGKRPGSDLEGDSPSKKRATEFDKYWKSVTDNSQDFQAWTVLLQYVDQNSDLEEGRKAYDKFFERYPYCYGYWKKYADLEKRKGSHESTVEVFNRGLQAIPLSVDLWIHYLEYIAAKYEDNEDYVREQYERSIDVCGLEFRSDRLWDSYIAWETRMTSTFGLQRVVKLYDRLLATPISKHAQHWQKFEEFVKNYLPSELLSAEDYQNIRKTVIKEELPKKEDGTDAPPGDEGSPKIPSAGSLDKEEEIKLIQNHIIQLREEVHEKTIVTAKVRWQYEASIKRPYFHVKPLEKSQLAAWRVYLDFEISQSDDKLIRILFERCLIACALYEEFWIRYIEYLEGIGSEADEIRVIFQRVCYTHLPYKVKPHVVWAAYEEGLGNTERAIEILVEFQSRMGLSVEAQMALIGIYRRRKDREAIEKIFQSCLENFRLKGDPDGYCGIIVKYARFIHLEDGSVEKAIDFIQEALDLFKDNGKLLLALSEMAMICTPPRYELAANSLKTGTKDTLDGESRIAFAYRYTHFIIECGDDPQKIRDAMRLQRDTIIDVRAKQIYIEDTSANTEKVDEYGTKTKVAVSQDADKINGTTTNGPTDFQSYQNSYGATYNQAYPSNYSSTQYPNWNYTPQAGSYNYAQQGWGSYANYYGQR